MIVSWNWLNDWVDCSKVEGGPKGLALLLTGLGLEVEGVRSLAEGMDLVLTVKILEKQKHPTADRLTVCMVSAGNPNEGPLQIVCGATNMKAGDIVACAQVGALLPNGLKIEKSKIRGVESFGMLCSEEELCLKSKSEGILILPPTTQLGKKLSKVLGLDDVLFDVNITPNRGDCLSHVGIAREVAASLGLELKKPKTTFIELNGSPVLTGLEAGASSEQFLGCTIEGVKVGPSPDWMVKKLEAIGARSINNVVDCTNYVLYELGQPTHAYDANQIGKKLIVRTAKQGEALALLDDGEVKLQGFELVIADEKQSVSLAGVMGGRDSQVTEKTQNLFLECAEFSPTLVRKAAFLHQRRSEASLRFEKGIDPEGLHFALSRLAQLIIETAGGKIKGGVSSVSKRRESQVLKEGRKIEVKPDFFQNFLGMDVSESSAKKILGQLKCEVVSRGPMWVVRVPNYRQDLNTQEDLSEEIARTIGYDKIPSTIPVLTSSPQICFETTVGEELELIDRAKDSFVKNGFLENLQFAFTSKKWLSEFGLSSSIQVINPLSEEQEVMIPSLIPGLVETALKNWNHHFGSEILPLRLFELRPSFVKEKEVKAHSNSDTGTFEELKLAFFMSGPRYAEGLRAELGEVDLYDLKAVMESFFDEMGTKGVRFRSFSMFDDPFLGQILHPAKSIEVLVGKDKIGAFGEAHPKLKKQMKFRTNAFLGELNWPMISKLSRKASLSRKYKSWPEYPPIERDFALLVKSDVTSDKIVQIALKAGQPLAKVAKIFDIYKGHQVAEGMTSFAVRVIFFEEGRSLKEDEADLASSKILAQWKSSLGAELR